MKLADMESIYVQSGTTSFEIATSTGLLKSNEVPVNFFEDASTATNIKAYGHSFVTGSTLDRKVYTIDAPIKGIAKTISMHSTAADTLGTSCLTVVGTGSTDIYIIDNSTAIAADGHYLTFQRPYTAVSMVGLSTTKWGILSMISASTVLAQASTATGVLASISSSNSSGAASS
jgi:hypothetical protein